MLLAAHPDDEVIGAGGQYAAIGRLELVHLTDGASSHKTAWKRGWLSRGRYAACRLEESRKAASLSGVAASATVLGARDGSASLSLVALVEKLARMLGDSRPDLVLTHAYEGGHPDHDAAAFAARAACRLVPGIPLWEMTGYHAAAASDAPNVTGSVGGVAIETGRFLAPAASMVRAPEIAVTLDAQASQLKQRMLGCFATQRHVLAMIAPDLAVERFRPAPDYDFRVPPHAGLLLYEAQDWIRCNGAQWRALAEEASRRLAKV
jgi:LmbE family N-acetylglucosaminyl deacetylase